ncbi:hypothetical protein TWF730_001337 [Orbilia blumenaviensis]|uniref:Uncharacterized protein n=1 Tax=Orbilia blumenaviensis TaxID=1796055 RepID=A0AAV9ULU0_9PEZI
MSESESSQISSTTPLRLRSYNIIKDAERANHVPQNPAVSFVNGAIVGLVTTLPTLPFGTMKTRSQCVKAATAREAFQGIPRDGGIL